MNQNKMVLQVLVRAKSKTDSGAELVRRDLTEVSVYLSASWSYSRPPRNTRKRSSEQPRKKTSEALKRISAMVVHGSQAVETLKCSILELVVSSNDNLTITFAFGCNIKNLNRRLMFFVSYLCIVDRDGER